jgi:hypothetical protein
MSNGLTLGQRAAAELKAARAKSGTLDWAEVARIIDACNASAPASGGQAVAKATAEAIYSLYPRKVGKVAALKAIGRAAERLAGKEPSALAYLLERTQLYSTAVALWPKDERQFCPHPATWFNQGRYDDDPNEWKRGTEPKPAARDYSQI